MEGTPVRIRGCPATVRQLVISMCCRPDTDRPGRPRSAGADPAGWASCRARYLRAPKTVTITRMTVLNPPRSGSPIGSCLDERVDQMTPVPNLGRRAFLAGTTGIAAASLIGCAGNEPTSTPDSGSAGGSIKQFTTTFQGNGASEELDPGIHTAFILFRQQW